MMPDNRRSQFAMPLQTVPTSPDSSRTPVAPSEKTGQIAQLVKTVSDLNIARKTRLIYPGDHDNVRRSLHQAHRSIETALGRIGRLTISTSGETLLVADQHLDTRNKVPREMANMLKKFAIAALAFEQGLEREELADLLGVLVRDPEDILENGGIAECIKPLEFRHIRVYPIDYSRLEITEEEEITRTGQPPESSVWDRFVDQLDIHSAPDEDSGRGPSSDPIFLAGMLNQNQVDLEKAVESYSQLLQSQFSDKTVIAEKADQSKDGSIAYFNDLMQELHPNLREQFLSVTFDHCIAHDADPSAMELLDGLGKEMAVQMLRYAKADGKKISPSLLSLIQKIGHLPLAGRQHNAPAVSSDELSSIEIGALLRSEDYDHFVDREYSAMLKGLAGHQHQAEPIEALSDTLAQGLDNCGIDCHISNALTRLMMISGDSQSYRDWARQLMLTLDDLVDDGAFGCLAEIYVFISTEDGFQKDTEKKRIAGLILHRFSDSRFIANVIERVGDGSDASVADAAVLLKHIGDTALFGVLDALSPKDNEVQTRVKLDLLAPFGHRVAEEADQRLTDPRSAYLRLMARLIRRYGDAEMAEGMRHLISHERRDVRLEVLGALFKYENGWGLVRLRALINGEWSEETAHALELAGRYNVRAAVPLLISTLQRWSAIPGDIDLFMAILATLGRIGDPVALPALSKLAHRRWSLAPGRLRQLQHGVFDSLFGYPYAAVADLVHFGLNHKDPVIKARCGELLKAYHSRPSTLGHDNDTEEAS